MEKKTIDIMQEMDRVWGFVRKDIGALRNDIEELSRNYKFVDLMNDNTAMLLKMHEDIVKRLEILEGKSA